MNGGIFLVEITYEPAKCQVVLCGHAGSGKKGADLVCAAVSTLACTLSANVERLLQGGQLRRAVIRLDSGNARIRAFPACGHRNQVRAAFETICTGFELLMQMHPNHVRHLRKE